MEPNAAKTLSLLSRKPSWYRILASAICFSFIFQILFYLGCGNKQESNIDKGSEMPQYTVYFFKIIDAGKAYKANLDLVRKGIRIEDPSYAVPGEKFVGTAEYYGEGKVVLNITDKELKKELESPISIMGGGSEGEGEYKMYYEETFTFQPGTINHLAAARTEIHGYKGNMVKNKGDEQK